MIITTPEQIKNIRLEGIVGFDIETSGLDPKLHEILLVSLTDEKDTYVLDFTAMDIKEFKRLKINNLFIGHNIIFDIKFVYYHTGILIKRASDTMVNEMVLSAGKFVPYEGKYSPFTLSAVAKRRLGKELPKDAREEFINYSGDTLSDQAYEYAADDTKILRAIYNQQIAEIQEHQLERIYKLECDLLPVTAKLELAGFEVNLEALQELDEPFQRYIRVCEQAFQDLLIKNGGANRVIWDDTYSCVSITSKDQVKEALNSVGVDVDSLDTKKLAKWDLRKNKDTLETLLTMLDDNADIQEAIDHFGGYNNPYLRAYSFFVGADKLYNTYIKGLQRKRHEDGRVYPWFKQVGARSTGRYSSDAQQIPKNDKLERLGFNYSIRECIVAPKKKKLIIADFSAIELVIIAERSGDQKLAYEHLQGDLHTLVTREVMGIFWPIAKEINDKNKKSGTFKLLRDFSKTLSYGIAYGVTGKSLASQAEEKLASTGLKLTEKQGNEAVEAWKRLFPDAGLYLDSTARKAVTKGYTSSLWGRKRWYDLDYLATNKWAKLAAMREGSNQEIQSTSCDMTKLSMIYFDRMVDNKRAMLILTVHDELVVECDEDYAEDCCIILKNAMEQAGRDILPVLGYTITVNPSISERYDK